MKKFFKFIFYAASLITWIALIAWAVMGERFDRQLKERRAEAIGALADQFIAQQTPSSQQTDVKTVSGLHHIPIRVELLGDNILRATGVANSYLIQTNEGNVLFDNGLGTQAAKHKRLLQKAAPGPVTHIILSHSHADHIGGTKYWKAEYPNAKIITHRKFVDGQRYLLALQDHFWNRNRLLYTFMPEQPPDDDAMFAYGGIEPDILIDDHTEYRFESGGTEFVIMPTPGAEGDDNLILWLPQSKNLFSGDFFGPLFPMMPNLFTLRGERFRDPMAYIKSLNSVIKLRPHRILPSHFDPVENADQLQNDLELMRNATAYVHDATIEGMNQGKSVWQLMRDIQLPSELNISQGHGKVSWNVRSIWEYYSTWFKFESTTELYAVPVRETYADLANLAGGSALLNLAEQKLANAQPEQALHLIEIGLTGDADEQRALTLRLNALEALLDRAWKTTSNYSETGWLQARINTTKQQLEKISK